MASMMAYDHQHGEFVCLAIVAPILINAKPDVTLHENKTLAASAAVATPASQSM